ncbi:T9SS type A sorting domain-containing protein [Candidatus Poribacteria bacterium]|nr:T9SS type A sorting domain-containing protein [Candidatus Poribacteria bacterium]MYH83193.1 T9SS type A sorting domain-containing protein [Candidatus Poribacteria bacterium]MYK94999.1 T9SS type A sorting domain-containing protein [Candidatus Poribacteria bacterium]
MKTQRFKPVREKIICSFSLLTLCFGWTVMSHASAVVSVQPTTPETPKIGEHLAVQVNIIGGETVAGYQFTLAFDPAALRYVSAADAGYFPSGAYTVPLPKDQDITVVAAALKGTATAPDGTLATVTFEVLTPNPFSSLHLTDVILSDATATALDVRFIGKHDGTELWPLTPPEETAMLPNYPNPFNPETWIPYQLAAPAEVTLTIYGPTGHVVRTLALGHQAAGVYASKSRAAYWDGRNDIGERVASGLYFYTLTAGGFNATGKMLIMK